MNIGDTHVGLGLEVGVWKDLGEVSAGHRIMNHEGKCKFLHGHNYRVHVKIVGEVGRDGMIVDFSEIKKLKRVLDRYDHKTILEEIDPLAKLIPPEHLVLFAETPTVEHLARTWFKEMEHQLKYEQRIFHALVESIVVTETASSSCQINRPKGSPHS